MLLSRWAQFFFTLQSPVHSFPEGTWLASFLDLLLGRTKLEDRAGRFLPLSPLVTLDPRSDVPGCLSFSNASLPLRATRKIEKNWKMECN
uniref:Uncharacterized protein n=1 Tax=Arundo donax TaxID=35708 RepID=A0A0A9CTX5_ARUDO